MQVSKNMLVRLIGTFSPNFYNNEIYDRYRPYGDVQGGGFQTEGWVWDKKKLKTISMDDLERLYTALETESKAIGRKHRRID